MDLTFDLKLDFTTWIWPQDHANEHGVRPLVHWLTFRAEVSTLGADSILCALLHLPVGADGAAEVWGVPVAGTADGGLGVLVVGHSWAALTTPASAREMWTEFPINLILQKFLPTFFDLGFWHHFCIGNPHCCPPLIHLKEIRNKIETKKQRIRKT